MRAHLVHFPINSSVRRAVITGALVVGVIAGTAGAASAEPVTVTNLGTIDIPGVPAQVIDLGIPQLPPLPKLELPQLPPPPVLPPAPDLTQPIVFEVPANNFEVPGFSAKTLPGTITVTPLPFSVEFTQTPSPAPVVPPAAPAPAPAPSKGQAIVAAAEAQLGTPYSWGGNQPGGFDCSGLVQYSYAQQGVSIPRVSNAQIAGGTPVSLNALQPGDVLSFYNGGHVGIYAGDGMVIHSPTSGDVVKKTSLQYMQPESATRYV